MNRSKYLRAICLYEKHTDVLVSHSIHILGVRMRVFKNHDKTTNPSTGLEASRISIKCPDTSNDVFRLHAERDVCKGSTDTPKRATLVMDATLKLGNGWFVQNPLRWRQMRMEHNEKQNPRRFSEWSMSVKVIV